MHFALWGWPSDIGTGTEVWAWIRAVRESGHAITLMQPYDTSSECVSLWRNRLGDIGVSIQPWSADVYCCPPFSVDERTICVGFNDPMFCEAAPHLMARGHRTVWLNCTNRVGKHERAMYQHWDVSFSAYIYQSLYQANRLAFDQTQALHRDTLGAVMKGMFFPEDFKFRRKQDRPFAAGTLCSGIAPRFLPEMWDYVKCNSGCYQFHVIGLGPGSKRQCGAIPPFGEVWDGTMPTQQFMDKLHCLVPLVGESEEGWFRAGLEAMASGVVVIASNDSAWPEMIRAGETGVLVDREDYDTIQWHLERFAKMPSLREDMALAAKETVDEWYNADARAELVSDFVKLCEQLQGEEIPAGVAY